MTIDIPWIADLTKSMAALLGAAVMGGFAVLAGFMIMTLRALFAPRAGNFRVPGLGSINPGFFYFLIVAPVWAIVGAFAGYQLGGQ
ncbi:hypothetical protein ACVDG8_032205 [Mesorhizobium sp. ORM8.1]